MSSERVVLLRKELLSCEYSLKHARKEIEQLNEFLKNKQSIIETQDKELKALKSVPIVKELISTKKRLEKAENLIKALGSMNDDHLLVVREGEAIHILLKEAERVISAYLESCKGE